MVQSGVLSMSLTLGINVGLALGASGNAHEKCLARLVLATLSFGLEWEAMSDLTADDDSSLLSFFLLSPLSYSLCFD